VATVASIYEYLNQVAPFSIQMDFDNAGFLVGHANREVKRILVSLDITKEVVEEAISCNCQLIVSHHPVIFHPLKSVTDQTVSGQVIMALVEGGVAAICAHTNLDAVQGGVNCCLAKTLELSQITQLHPDGVDDQGQAYGIGRVGIVERDGMTAQVYAAFVKERLGAASVRYVDGGRLVKKVAVGGGSCGSMLEDVAAMGCDTFVTADVKYDQFLQAKAMGISLLDAGHYPTENVVCPQLVENLSSQFPTVQVFLSGCHKEVLSGV
jgi:dinuclear metal center YbgI/SA1388 family protein